MPRLCRLTFYYDIFCPNSYAGIKYLLGRPELNAFVDFVPIDDRRVDKLLSPASYPRNKWGHRGPRRIEGEPLVFREMAIKPKVLNVVDERLPWKPSEESNEIRRLALIDMGVYANHFLSAVKDRCSYRYLDVMSRMGRACWEVGMEGNQWHTIHEQENQQKIHRSWMLARFAREAGIQLADSEEMIANLSHKYTIRRMLERCEEAAKQAPYFVADIGTGIEERFDDVNHLPSLIAETYDKREKVLGG